MRTRLMRGKFWLLFMTFGILLAIPAMAMALTADPSGNTSPAPTIQSDKADYAPGELVTLTGGNWQPGESVHINVNDDEGQTWSRNVDVTADASGNISDSFNLPDWFVATYSVTATGSSGTATTSFTDARVVTTATLDGGNSVNVTPGSSITADVQVTTDGSGANARWRSTGWRVATTAGSMTCVNTTNHDIAGVNNESVSITAPNTNGTYNAYFIAYASEDCNASAGGGQSNTFTISNGVVVKSNQATLNYTGPTTGAYGDKLTLSSSGGSGTGAVTYESTGTACAIGTGADAGKLLITSGTGTCSVTAKKAGDNDYNSATSAAQAITVNPKAITVTPDSGQSKVYGQADPTLTYSSSPALESGDSFTGALGRAAGNNVGNYAINLGTLSAGSNYNLSLSSPTVNFAITAKALTISGLSAQNKVYDGNATATITGSPSLVGVISPDNVSLSGTASGTFNNASVGDNKPVAVSGLSLAGADAGNYSLTPLVLSANITAWNLNGFYQPIDMGDVLNTVKNGSTVPVKFELFSGTTELTSTSAVSSISAKQVNCALFNGDPMDEIEYLAPTGGTSLRYDATAGQFIYNWATPKKPNTCYNLTMTAADGSTLTAYFKLR